MGKSGKILAVVAVVVLLVMVGGIFWLSSAMDNVGAVKIETEDVPCGLEWGMTEEEARAVLESAGCVKLSEKYNTYQFPVYQGQAMARGHMVLLFDEKGKLYEVDCSFKAENSEILTVTPEMLDELEAAFVKAYEKECEEAFVDNDPEVADLHFECCFMEKSMVLFMRNYDRWFSVSFYDLESESNADWFESVRSELVAK